MKNKICSTACPTHAGCLRKFRYCILVRGLLKSLPSRFFGLALHTILIPLSCPLGSSCCGGFPDYPGEVEFGGCNCGRKGGACGGRCTCKGHGHGGYGGFGRGRYGGWNWLGSVTVIPCESIASFTHNAI
jgi:hypothetical protein